MARPLGYPKTGGRVLGTPNKRTVHLIDQLEKRNFDVVEEILMLLPELDASKRADLLVSLLPYIYAKKRAVEVPPERQSQVKVHITLPANGYETPGTKLVRKEDLELLIAAEDNAEEISHLPSPQLVPAIDQHSSFDVAK